VSCELKREAQIDPTCCYFNIKKICKLEMFLESNWFHRLPLNLPSQLSHVKSTFMGVNFKLD